MDVQKLIAEAREGPGGGFANDIPAIVQEFAAFLLEPHETVGSDLVKRARKQPGVLLIEHRLQGLLTRLEVQPEGAGSPFQEPFRRRFFHERQHDGLEVGLQQAVEELDGGGAPLPPGAFDGRVG